MTLQTHDDRMPGEFAYFSPPAPDTTASTLSRPKAVLIATVLLWLSGLVLSVIRGTIDGRDEFVQMAVARTLIYIGGALMCWCIAAAVNLFRRQSAWHRVGIAVAAVVTVAFAFNELSYVAYGFVNPRIGDKNLNLWLFNIIYWVWFYAAWTAIYFSITYAYSVRDEERRSARLQAMASQAQMQALHFQINPHFLFNTLNGISALILDRKTAEADEMVAQLSDFLRETLTLDPLAVIPLADEIRLQRDYLAIEQHRFHDLTFLVDVPDELADLHVPPLILQPLVENAIRHGAACSKGAATIGITAAVAADDVVLTVRDDCRPVRVADAGTGTGIRNVRDRLGLYYGPGATLAAEPLWQGGFEARLIIPRGAV